MSVTLEIRPSDKKIKGQNIFHDINKFMKIVTLLSFLRVWKFILPIQMKIQH
jgi:hypothetical protein